eukprot:6204329-Pleurochrysis_carterae.AAC.1
MLSAAAAAASRASHSHRTRARCISHQKAASRAILLVRYVTRAYIRTAARSQQAAEASVSGRTAVAARRCHRVSHARYRSSSGGGEGGAKHRARRRGARGLQRVRARSRARRQRGRARGACGNRTQSQVRAAAASAAVRTSQVPTASQRARLRSARSSRQIRQK